MSRTLVTKLSKAAESQLVCTTPHLSASPVSGALDHLFYPSCHACPTLIRTAPHTAGLSPPETWNLLITHNTQPEEQGLMSMKQTFTGGKVEPEVNSPPSFPLLDSWFTWLRGRKSHPLVPGCHQLNNTPSVSAPFSCFFHTLASLELHSY